MLPSIATDVLYAENDGKPLVDNAVQFCRIVMIQGGLDTLGSDSSKVFETGGLFWLWVEGGGGLYRFRISWQLLGLLKKIASHLAMRLYKM